MSLLYQQAPKREAMTLRVLIEGVESGQSLSKLFLQEKFHPMVPALALVGEESGNLVRAFTRLGEHFQNRFAWKQKVIGSLIYPAVVAVVMVIVTLLVLYGILPRFETMYLNLGFALPKETERLFSFTSMLRQTLPWFFLGFVLLCLLPFTMKRMIMSRFPQLGAAVFAIPGIKRVWRLWLSYRLADTIAILAASGAPLLHALDTCERTAHFSLERKVVRSIIERILSGSTLTDALRSQYWIDPMLVHSVQAAEASGDLSGVCQFAAKEFEADLQRIVQRLVQLVEPAIILGLGILVGFVVLAVVMPMMQMVQSI
ncbi:general secretion pathway protein F [Effusibacillus lacus]|nr:general secretion pathway protein F [Effusibacillus lacus]